MPYRVDIYVPDSQKTTVNAKMNGICGESNQQDTFSISKVIAATTWWYSSIIFNEAQFTRFKARVYYLGTLWYAGSSTVTINERTLLESNSNTASLGGIWTIASSEADVTIATPTDSGLEIVYASPLGSPENEGTEESPLDLESVAAGYTNVDVILLNGAYQMQNDFDFDLTNRSIEAETIFGVTIDVQNFAVSVMGDTGTLRGVIFESSTMERTSLQAGSSSPTDVSGGFVTIDADNSLVHNCVFRNLLGFSCFTAAVNTILDACQAYYIGWLAPDRGHGHSIYTQNTQPSKTLRRNFFHDSFGWGIHAYSSNGGNLAHFIFEENICFRNGSLSGNARPDILLGADSAQSNAPIFRRNRTYGGSNGIAFYGQGAINATLEDNYCPNNIDGPYTAISETGNIEGVVGNTAFLEADEHNVNMAYLAVYNQANANTVQVDVSAIFTNGDIVDVMNAQDFENDVQALTVSGGLITVNMQVINRTVETPIGWPAPASSFPQFGAFILRKQ